MAKNKVTVKLVGADEAKKALKIIESNTIANTAEKLIARGYEIEGDAKLIADQKGVFEHGRLIASLSTNWSGSGMSEGKTGAKAEPGDGVKQPRSRRGRLTVAVGTNVEYGIYNEFGTYKLAARPFLFPAYFKNYPKTPKDVREAVSRAMKARSLKRTRAIKI